MLRVAFVLLASTIFASPALSAEPAADGDGIGLAELSDPIVVIGRREVSRTATATKTDTPLQDVPQAISVVTSEEIAQQGMQSIVDVLRTVPGATVASGEGHRDQILLRGQSTTADFFVDGIRDDVQYYRGLYNLDRVEVLKGPNAMIFGRGGGGGIVNRVTKKAGAGDFAAGALSADSNGAWSAAGDAQMGIGAGAGLRLNVAQERFDSFRDHVDGHRTGLNPTLGWQLGEATRIDLTYEYSHDRRVVDRGIPSFEGKPLRGEQDRFFGDEDVNRMRFDAHVGDLAVSHDFGGLKWTGKARIGTYDKFYRNALAATALRTDGTVCIEAYQSRTKRDALFVQNDLVAEVATGGIDHQLLIGTDYGRQDTFADRQQGFFDTAGTITRLYVPLADSDALPAITFRDSPARRATSADTLATSFGVYIQDQARIGEHVELIAGLRRDWFKLDYDDRLSTTELGRKDRLWSPRLGIVLKPVPALSLYGSWSKSFLPQSGDQFSSLTATTASLEPERFLNREVGLKWAATKSVNLTLAGYVLDRTNTRATDPVTLLTVLTGEQRTKGVEASAQGRFGSAFSFSATAALQDAEIRKDTASAPAGRKVASVPKFTSSLWGRYNVSKRFGAGLGLYHQSKSYASISNAVTVPGYTRVDAAAFVDLSDRIALQLNLENVFDKDYIGVSHTDNNLTPGNPRTLRATVRLGL